MLAHQRLFYQTCAEWQHLENQVDASRRRRIFFELLEITVFDLLHEGFALEEVALEVGGELVGDDEKLVVGHFGKRDGAARGN